ncbi:hypothetical protein [Thalassoroseus pseudoceratinae]|uniref:hypothetical protein n=1 Tax=Thalassoroseus pseudoceratinae TaxID=2713176 RepID=UPI00141F24AA|nr:hypothetical protein [Thalassoroseus pseudoceratinae]
MDDMQPPKRIPINREEEYHTHYIGQKGAGGFFMGFVTPNVGPLNFELLGDDGWESKKTWFSVVHHFDADGKHTHSDIESHGTTADGEDAVIEKARAGLEAKLNAIGELTFCDIAVERFQVEHDGCIFGLLTTEECDMFDEEEDDEEMRYHVHLLPNDLLFYPPWTGEYDT